MSKLNTYSQHFGSIQSHKEYLNIVLNHAPILNRTLDMLQKTYLAVPNHTKDYHKISERTSL